jgi:hypothetical protein
MALVVAVLLGFCAYGNRAGAGDPAGMRPALDAVQGRVMQECDQDPVSMTPSAVAHAVSD